MEVNKGEQAIKILPLSSQKEKESFLTQADSQCHLQYIESVALWHDGGSQPRNKLCFFSTSSHKIAINYEMETKTARLPHCFV